jgi:hypothetical protein
MVQLEDYECDGCRNDGNIHMGCGDCPHNSDRIREWERKYGNSTDSSCEHRIWGGFVSD